MSQLLRVRIFEIYVNPNTCKHVQYIMLITPWPLHYTCIYMCIYICAEDGKQWIRWNVHVCIPFFVCGVITGANE